MHTSSQPSRYRLEPYKPGGRNRYQCPQCGDKRSLVRYIDTLTGEQIAPECGRCNHESRCGYHYPPHEYFADNPNMQRDCPCQYVHDQPLLLSRCPWTPPTAPPPPQTEFYPLQWAEQAQSRSSTFRRWFESLPYEAEVKQQVLRDYLVGGTQWDTYVEHVNYGPAVIFWMIDEQQRVHDAKLMAYQMDGHRVQGWGDSMRSLCVKRGVGPQLEQTDKCLFGLHLLPRHPDCPVAIVESEKTALICACHYPQYLWMATGGCGGLNAQKLQPLMQSRLIIFPDSGEYDKWHRIMRDTHHPDYRISELLEPFPPNTDLADVILGKK